MKPKAERFARNLDPAITDAVRRASSGKTHDRVNRLNQSFADLDAARTQAAAIKDEILDDLDTHLKAFEERARQNGITFHHAATADEARSIILEICRSNPGPIVKGKSMATEEIHLNQALEQAGFEVTETDLGEYVVQIDNDTPSHIVTPIIHKDRRQVAQSFKREGLGPYTEEPAELAAQARRHLRQKFRNAKIGISGVNFAVVDSGQLVIVENEGNNRLSTTAPDIHIAVAGIEKLVPRAADIPLFLQLLAGSATGQAITTYVHWISGPRPDGPKEVHLVLIDAGRRKILDSRYRSILRCIRCGACLNVCPVYRQISGHGYGHVYPGPVGAVLAPLLDQSGRLRQLPKASTLCGACEEVCPVKIPIPDMLVHLRNDFGEAGSWSAFAKVASSPNLWKTAGIAARSGIAPGWTEFRDAPSKEGRSYRSWWESRGEAERRIQPPRESKSMDEEPTVLPTRQDPWAMFEETHAQLGGRVLHAATLLEALTRLEVDLAECVGDDEFKPMLAEPPNIWEARYGITRADIAVAETGTLVTAAGPNRSRLNSLVPPIHIAVVSQSAVVTSLDRAAELSATQNTVWITGPSRTADIEGILVRGVHGPGELIVVVLPD